MRRVYSLYDRKLREYGALMVEKNDFACQRGLSDGISQAPQSMIALHPGDFDLYHVGEWDEEKGVLLVAIPPSLVCNLQELVKSEES